LRALALSGRAGQKRELERLHAERTARELRLEPGQLNADGGTVPVYSVLVPGEVEAPAFGLKIRVENSGASEKLKAALRTWSAGDRVRLRHSGSPRKVKEILERMKVTGSDRAIWPVLEVAGRIVWMKGVELEPEAGLKVWAEAMEPAVRTNTDEG